MAKRKSIDATLGNPLDLDRAIRQVTSSSCVPAGAIKLVLLRLPDIVALLKQTPEYKLVADDLQRVVCRAEEYAEERER